jgi:hypothetical protein
LFAPLLLGLIVAAATTGTLAPRSVIAIPPAVAQFVSDVAWENADAVLISTDRGVRRFSPRTGTSEPLIADTPLPDGLPFPESVASDGATVSTVSALSLGGYAMRIADRKRLIAQRVRFLPLDVAVRGQRTCVLAIELHQKTDEAVFCGAAGEAWTKFKPVHRLASGQEILRSAIEHLGGAIAMGADGSLAVVTSAEPGVFRYAPDGKLIEKSGQSFDELVVPQMGELRERFAGDIAGRYRLLLNTQPIIDDLVLTPRGPAIVVRIAEKERIRWELWWPRTDGRAVPPTRLAIERLGPYGHLRCDARGASLACVASMPDRKNASDPMATEHAPHLWIFELPK